MAGPKKTPKDTPSHQNASEEDPFDRLRDDSQHASIGSATIRSFSWYGVGPIHWIKTVMDQHVYVDILVNVMLPYAEENEENNDPKHTSAKAKKWFADKNPAQSPDLNPIENL